MMSKIIHKTTELPTDTKVLFVLLPLLSKHDHLRFLFFPQTMKRESSRLASPEITLI